MNGQVIYNVPHALALGWPIAIYFFVTGLSAGAFFLAVLPQLIALPAYRRMARVAAVLAPILLIMAPIFLVLDLEQPARFYRVLLYRNSTSPLSYGAFLLPLYGICAVLYAYFMFRDELNGNWLHKLGGALGLNKANAGKMARIFGLTAIPFAFALEGYTGFILGIVRAHELWNTAMMPVLFLTSAIISGMALVMLVSILTEGKQAQSNGHLYTSLGQVLGGAITLELFMVAGEILVMLAGQAGGREAAQLLLSGAMAPWFLGVEIGLGALVPLVIVFNKRTANRIGWQALASVLVLIGVLAMRFVLVIGGQMIPLS